MASIVHSPSSAVRILLTLFRQLANGVRRADNVHLPRLIATGLIVAATVWHIAYLSLDCPLELASDEAHYWYWSRHLDWSYYSKGPLVAWLIRLSCELFGGLSIKLCGTEMIAVRLPAALCGGGLLAGLYV